MELRRFLRDRSNIFFVFLFPLLLVVVLGLQFGGGADEGRVAVAGARSPLRTALVAGLEGQGVSVSFGGAGTVREQVARERTDVALFVPPAAAAAFDAGEDVTLEVIAGSQQGGPPARRWSSARSWTTTAPRPARGWVWGWCWRPWAAACCPWSCSRTRSRRWPT